MNITVVPFDCSMDDIWFDYFVPERLEKQITVWLLVQIPIGASIRYGIVSRVHKKEESHELTLKSIIDIVWEDPFLFDYQVELLKWMSEYYFCLIHVPLSLIVPKHVQNAISEKKINKIKENEYTYKTCEQEKWSFKLWSENTTLLYDYSVPEKQEIFLQLISSALKEWKQILLLVPELVFSSQVYGFISEIYWSDVVFLSSTVSPWKRSQYYFDIRNSRAKIVVGTRLSIFYPYKDLWLIIVDEAHEDAYVSQKTPRYNTVTVACKIWEMLGIKIVLSSSTPKITHMYRALKWDWNKQRVSN